MSASSRPTADKQRLPEIQSRLDAHRKALQTRKSGGKKNRLFKHGKRPAKLAFFCWAGSIFLFGLIDKKTCQRAGL
jgi:hypothetical protein